MATLNESDAMPHPYYHRWKSLFPRVPTVNPPLYEQACYLRWLVAAGGLRTDSRTQCPLGEGVRSVPNAVLVHFSHGSVGSMRADAVLNARPVPGWSYSKSD